MCAHLEEIKSKLYTESETISLADLSNAMNLSQGSSEHLFPKNIGLLMFSKNPQKYFQGAIIEVVEFPEGLTKPYTEKTFTGPIQKQLIDVLSYIKTNIIKTKVIKYKDREKSDRFENYPYAAIEEALANAVYHRNYELIDPIEVRILPTSLEVISFNGVNASIKKVEFESGRVSARRYRNRRIGEFLKELQLTEGRGTGIPSIFNALHLNGSPAPKFDTNDPDRSHFLIEIPIHSAFIKTISKPDASLINPLQKQLLLFCKIPRSRNEIFSYLKISNQTKNYNTRVLPMIQNNWLELTIKNNAKDKNQKYVITLFGITVIERESN